MENLRQAIKNAHTDVASLKTLHRFNSLRPGKATKLQHDAVKELAHVAWEQLILAQSALDKLETENFEPLRVNLALLRCAICLESLQEAKMKVDNVPGDLSADLEPVGKLHELLLKDLILRRSDASLDEKKALRQELEALRQLADLAEIPSAGKTTDSAIFDNIIYLCVLQTLARKI